jgi:hypothetical protein
MATRKPGRPKENHEKLTCYLEKDTMSRIQKLKQERYASTLGRVIDKKFKQRGITAA